MSTQLLEEVRLLTNFETDKEKLIQVILAGQDELADILDRYDLRQLKQRVSTRLHIKPLTAEGITAYIGYRWSRAFDLPSPVRCQRTRHDSGIERRHPAFNQFTL